MSYYVRDQSQFNIGEPQSFALPKAVDWRSFAIKDAILPLMLAAGRVEQ